MFETKFVEKIKTQFIFIKIFFEKFCRLWENVEKYDRAGQATGDDAHALYTGYLRLKTYTQNILYLMIIDSKNDCKNAPKCYVIRTLQVFL